MSLGPHAAFILATYGAAVAVVAGLIAWIWLDFRAQKRLLGHLEASGVTRRSAALKEPA